MIIFYLGKFNLSSASVRYRAMLPALYLNRQGVAAKVCSGEIPSSILRQAKAVVIVNAFSRLAVELCARANQFGIPVFVDLCDDIFEDGYGAATGKDINQYYFRSMAAIAAGIVATTDVLATKIRRHSPQGTVVHVIPDMMERIEDVQLINSLACSIYLPNSRRLSSRLNYTWRSAKRMVFKKKADTPPGALPSSLALSRSQRTSSSSEKIIVWFGHHGAQHSESGMTLLLWLAADLARLSKEFGLRLVIISNSREKFDRYIKPLPFPTEYVSWTPKAVYEQMQRATLCVVPFGKDSFNQAKSPNRVLLALSSGVPVVCSDLPSLGPLKNSVLIEDWYNSIKTYLTRPDIAENHLKTAADTVASHFSGQSIAERWGEVVRLARKRRKTQSRRPRLLCFVQLAQDFDLLFPVIKAARADFDVTVTIRAELALSAPSVMERLAQQVERIFFVHDAEIESLTPDDPRISSGVLITASETTGRAHRVARLFVEAAKRAGVRTFTLQHGVENIGLTYRDAKYDESVGFVSDFVLTWNVAENLPDWVSDQTREKVIPVGCAKAMIEQSALKDFPLAGREFIAVFENLHWSRYDDDFRARFLADLAATARSNPNMLFVLKPHNAGQWFTTRCTLDHALPDNVLVIDPMAPEWMSYTSDAFLSFARAAITTPSTTAFDAARYNKPVAVVSYGMDSVQRYQPLPQIRTAMEWQSFVKAVQVKSFDHEILAEYRRRVSVRDNALPQLLNVLSAAAQGADKESLIAAASQSTNFPEVGGSVVPLAPLNSLMDDLPMHRVRN